MKRGPVAQLMPVSPHPTVVLPASPVKRWHQHLFMVAGRLIARLLENYQDLVVANIKLDSICATDSTLQPGLATKITGAFTYEDGFIGRFEAILEQSKNGEWGISHLYTVIPPAKMRDYLTNNQ